MEVLVKIFGLLVGTLYEKDGIIQRASLVHKK